MSHLICPLCGKYAPLSTFNPENIPLDLKTISFVGKGRGKGFAVGDRVSILGDEEITPVVASRVEALYFFFLEKGQILFPKILTNDEYYCKIITALQAKLDRSNYEVRSLTDSVAKLDEYELEKQVDYIIRESIDLEGARSQLVAGEEGWHLSLSPEPGAVEGYLCLLMMDLPNDLKMRLLSHIDSEQNPEFYHYLKRLPRGQSIAERLMDSSNLNTISLPDDSGKMVERITKPEYHPEYAEKAISLDRLKQIVRNVKKKLRDPSEPLQTFFETLYPKKLKLPYRGENDPKSNE